MYKTKALQDCQSALEQALLPTAYVIAGHVVEEPNSENIMFVLHSGKDRATVIVHPTSLEWNQEQVAERLTFAATQQLLNGYWKVRKQSTFSELPVNLPVCTGRCVPLAGCGCARPRNAAPVARASDRPAHRASRSPAMRPSQPKASNSHPRRRGTPHPL